MTMTNKTYRGFGTRAGGLAIMAAAMLSLSSAAWAQYGSSGPSSGSGSYGNDATSVPNAAPSTSGRSGTDDCSQAAGINNPNCSPQDRGSGQRGIPDRSGASSGSSGMEQDRDAKQPLPQTDK
jgi:hypothetical protein